MTLLDWLIVVLLNGLVIGCGFYWARGTHTSSQWFLGDRALPWWAIGLSMFATNVDNADIVAVTGSTYVEGLHIITVYAIGSAMGAVLAAFWITPAIYRQGFYTNAEYLESRFGPTARLLSALIQLQYRSSMLGLMIWSVYLLLTRMVEMPPVAAWVLIVAAVVLSGCYTAWGGLTSVVWTDAMQSVVMMIGGAVIVVVVYRAVGGWQGMTESLAYTGHEDLTHIGRFRGQSGMISPYVVVLGWTIIGSGYWTVNHTQTMRLMGARSLWDMKMAAIFGVAASLPIMIACACLGVFGRAAPGLEDLKAADTVYPLLANRYLTTGLKGLVAAGVVAAAISTFDSMGSALSAVFTRDIYARFLVRDGDDAHYVKAGRFATVGVLTLGFLYLPFILKQENMIKAFTTLIPVFVTPLLTTYILGVTTRVHRRSGVAGLLCGSAYGFIALCDREFYDFAWMPFWLSERWPALIWSLVITAASMAAATLITGPDDEQTVKPVDADGWLARSRMSLPPLREHPFAGGVPMMLQPAWWAALLVVVTTWVVFGLFW